MHNYIAFGNTKVNCKGTFTLLDINETFRGAFRERKVQRLIKQNKQFLRAIFLIKVKLCEGLIVAVNETTV